MSPTAAPTGRAAAEAPQLRRIGQIAVVAKDVARATAFYRDTLGLRLLFEAAPGLAFFDCGGARLMISAAEGPETSGSSILYFDVADIRRSFEALRARGVTFENEPHVIAPLGASDLWMAFFRDSENNLLALMSEQARPSA
ncbi:MAG TPA: VOC family protein [Gemmatimonadaceae bacterium]|nr:VOC family protein [Gemmatimonadaceae bacterium]